MTEHRLMRTRRVLCLLLAVVLAIFVAGCDKPGSGPIADPIPATSGTLVTDTESSLEAELLQADRDFARSVREQRLEGWVGAFDEEGVVLPAEGPKVVGREAIRDFYAPLFAEPSFEMSWSPAGAEVAASGDLGVTFGDWNTSAGKAGTEAGESEGKYVTVWKRAGDGRWRVLADIGNTRPKTTDDR